MGKWRDFSDNFMSRNNPLFFRKDGSLDFGPAVWAAAASTGMVSFVLAGFEVMSIETAAWAWLGSFVVIAAIAGAAAERAKWIAESRAAGEVARGIAEAGRDDGLNFSPLVYRDIADPDEL